MVKSTEIPDDCNDTIEPVAHEADLDEGRADLTAPEPDAAEPDIENHVRMGPGSIDALRFRWSVRKEDDGFFVDETIGTSRSAFSTGPMPHDAVIAFIDAREREACERLEQTRRKLAAAMPAGAFALAASSPPASSPAVKPAEPAPFLSPEQDQFGSFTIADETDIEISIVETSTVRISAEENSAEDADAETSEQRPEVNVEDVMDRIARLLDER